MKKWIVGIMTGIVALGLVACGGEADVKPGADDSKKSDLTIQEVFEKAQAVSAKQTSMTAKLDIEQTIQQLGMDLKVDSTIEMEMDMVLDPLEMHQTMKTDMGEFGAFEIEFYLTQDGFFAKNPETDKWMKFSESLYEEVTGSSPTDANPTLDLATFEKFVEDFKFEQDDNEYILKLKASGDQFKELAKEQLKELGTMDDLDGQMVLENMTIHQLEYEVFINKTTFMTTGFNMVMDIEAGDDEQGIYRTMQNVKTVISNVNEMEEIKIPQEIIDGAVEG